MAFCATCGNQMSDAAAFCTKCGTAHVLQDRPTVYSGSTVLDERRITFGSVVGWLWAIFVGLAGVIGLFESGGRSTALCFILSAVIAAPVTSSYMRNYWGVSVSGGLRIALVVGLTMLAGALAANSGFSSKISDSEVASTAPALSVTASQLAADYQANEVAADARYNQKIIEVSGTVDSIGKDITDTIYVTLQTGEEFAIVKPQLFFSDQHKNEAAALHKGQPLTVKCRCEGKFMNVLLKDCVIVTTPSASAEPNNAPQAAAPSSVISAEPPSNPTIENDLRLAEIGTNLQKLGVAATARGQQSDDASVKQRALVEGAADEIVGCEVWSSMASTTMSSIS
jgi:hypothetical protein